MATHTKEDKPTYDSNPFTLAFNALGRMFNSNVGWAIAILCLSVLGFLFQLISNAAQFAAESSRHHETSSFVTGSSIAPPASNPEPAVIAATVIFVVVIMLFFIVIATVIKVYTSGILSYVALESEKERPVSFKEAFEETNKRFWRLLGADLLAVLKIIGWTLLFIVPGIIAALRYSLLPYLIMNEPASEKGVGDSHTKTKVLVKGRLAEVFGLATVESIVPIIGSIAGISGKAALYNQLKSYNDQGLEKPKVHWLNYLGFIILGVIAVLALGLLALLLVIAAAN